jgi:hypothetical protein
MSYTIYRNITIKEVRNEKQTPLTRISDINGETYKRDSYYVNIAHFSNHTHATSHSLENHMKLNQLMSVAVNEHGQVIALINHTNNVSACIGTNIKTEIKEWLTAMIYIVPILAFGIGLCYRSIPFFEQGRNEGWIPLLFGLGAISFGVFLFKSLVLMAGEGKKALKELTAG